ncbi:MAG: cephalosporin hydroxylase family protein [Vicinamibacterales bacterium]
MTYTIDTAAQTIAVPGGDGTTEIPLYSREGFEILSRLWLKVGWNQKYTYTFSWMGRPVIQLPDDMVRLQEVIHAVAPDVIVETGVAHGGSLIYYASLCKAMGRGRVVGIDIEIRPHNRQALEAHPLFEYITLVEGSSVDPALVSRVKGLVAPGETVLVLLDSNHSRAHVRAELEAYWDMVTPGSYIVATDGVMQEVADAPRGTPEWREDNPISAVHDFLATRPEFVLEQPAWPFNESELRENVTHWPQAWLRRVK